MHDIKQLEYNKFHDMKTEGTLVAISDKFQGFIKVHVATPEICK